MTNGTPYAILFGLTCWATFSACRPDEETFAVTDVRDVPSHFPTYVEPQENVLNEAKWELGRHLFFDERLSADGTLSCASCHSPELAFADSLATSFGSNGALGVRNAPALVNMAWQPRFHREGGISTLEAQVLAPVQDPLEFNRDVVEAVEQLAGDEQYQAWADEGFGRPFDAYVMTRALAAFERTLISGSSRYDLWLQGNPDALTPDELRGMALFEDLACAGCHSDVWLTDFETHNNGLYAEYPDPGAFRLTFDSADVGAFKTPTLRNVALTAPYMFDGSLTTLEEVVNHYIAGGTQHPNQDPRIQPREVTAQDRADLVAFLNALSDEAFVTWAAGLRP